MNYLNAQQLAFILDIKKEDARAKMCNAWCREDGIEKDSYDKYEKVAVAKAKRNLKNKIEDPFPQAMPVELLSKHLNLPDLQVAVDDIKNNYLVRPSSKKWILCDYPEKEVKKCTEAGKPIKLSIPAALSSLLAKETKDKIVKEWGVRFPKARIVA